MDKDALKKIGDKIKKVRDHKGLTQANLAEELNMTASAFSKIELGINNTPIKRLLQIADILEVKISDFFEDKLSHAKETKIDYGYATKEDVSEIAHALMKLTKAVEKLQEELPKKKTPSKKKYIKK